MSKVSSITVTCNRPLNYGAVLQTYGLNKALTQMGVDAKVLDYYPEYYKKTSNSLIKRIVHLFLRIPDKIKGKKVFGDFLTNYVPMTKKMYHSVQEIKVDVPVADVYIAGSDQIWNCKNLPNGLDDTFFLTFVPKGAKKISYAASLAMPEIPSNQVDRYRNLVGAFNAVSVRETSGAKLLEDIGINNVQVVMDPVFLLTAKEWDEVASASSFIPHERYILVYGYNKQKNVYHYARRLAKKLGIKVYAVGVSIEDYLLDVDRFFWNATPNTFVKLIKNADAVVTNSFHGTVFSIVYNVPLHFFKVGTTANSRMIDLLKELELSDRWIKDENTLLSNSMSYSEANVCLNKLRARSLDFLRREVIK
ncbi:Polysaccharide pyruvyl transferase [Bifidobacterium ramosum]|uniref:Polysaccharide pyruvyl transferase n=1 Tax=Bifidobacterium ramosum TaxID=1798158 RepID=A0A6L4X0T4_9BIFI|nr:polysaccharide pyruvyl transferase family protein [Bifidobacterium ramosum]KAB8288023.1 Polysaccharide pyruvyl transferase [Bifidobacterium ramosum]NEG72080.1 polysaccharide pyruvyl transferase family protein [Bifidobacterium ramosum]